MINQRFQSDGSGIVLHGLVQAVFSGDVRDELRNKTVAERPLGGVGEDPFQRLVQHDELDLAGEDDFPGIVDETVLHALVDQNGVPVMKEEGFLIQGKMHFTVLNADEMVIIVMCMRFDAVSGLQRTV